MFTIQQETNSMSSDVLYRPVMETSKKLKYVSIDKLLRSTISIGI